MPRLGLEELAGRIAAATRRSRRRSRTGAHWATRAGPHTAEPQHSYIPRAEGRHPGDGVWLNETHPGRLPGALHVPGILSPEPS